MEQHGNMMLKNIKSQQKRTLAMHTIPKQQLLSSDVTIIEIDIEIAIF